VEVIDAGIKSVPAVTSVPFLNPFTKLNGVGWGQRESNRNRGEIVRALASPTYLSLGVIFVDGYHGGSPAT
jgi:hypothetical protein